MLRPFAALVAGSILAGCATNHAHLRTTEEVSAHRVPAAPMSITPSNGVVQVLVTLDHEIIYSSLGYWVEPGVVVTALRAVNDVPPTGGLEIIDGPNRFHASTWAGGNFDDSPSALLYVHGREKQPALPPLLPLCDETGTLQPDDQLLTREGAIPIPSSMAVQWVGAPVVSADGICRRGLYTADPMDIRDGQFSSGAVETRLRAAVAAH